MKVSVIIPVHNAEAYLQESVDSVLMQTCDDMEILLIDDASEDRSADICEAYAVQYPHIRTVHVSYRSAGAARNEGLRIAKGEYIVFVDADDALKSNASIRKMIELLDMTNADIAVGNYFRLWDGQHMEATGHNTFSSMDQSSGNFRYCGFFSVGTLSYVWGKAYRHSFLKEHAIRFQTYEYAEDKFFNFQCYIAQARYVFLEDVVYTYRKNDASISHLDQKDHAQCWLQLSADLMNELKEKNMDAQYGDLVAYTVNFAAFFDGKAQYCRSGKKLKAVKGVLQLYAASPVAEQCFGQLSCGKFMKEAYGVGWKIVMWTFAALMKIKALYILALGIKALVDFRIDERLSDTGRRKSK